MTQLDELLDRLEQLLTSIDSFAERERARVFELLDGLDELHRMALRHAADALSDDDLERARGAHASVAWLLDAYGIGVDERDAAESALESIRPYVHSHGGEIEVLDAADGVVRVKMSGTCSGCTASSVTLTEGVERALRDGWPGFVRLEVAYEEDAAPHPPPGSTLLQIERPGRHRDPGAA